ncbi:MAG: prepilin peptidase [Candidatus Eremiobacteraeota bacterium]|nr:prepilin peptidase [Candidatus Eremiobacteraeota bacterium]
MMDGSVFDNMRALWCSPDSPLSLLFIFLWGSLWGSFINVCIYRLPLSRSIVFPGSSCPSCGQPILWWQNIPLLSYLMLGAKCHYCYRHISWRYPLIELLTACLSVFLFRYYGGFTLEYVYYFIFTGLLIVIFFIDLDHWLILDCVSIPGTIAGVVGSFFVHKSNTAAALYASFFQNPPRLSAAGWNVADALAGIAIGYLTFSCIAFFGALLLRQEAMGGGDVKFAGLIGAFLGGEWALVAFVVSFFLGSFYAVPLLIVRMKKKKDPVPFGTFMALAAFITLIWGDRLLAAVCELQSMLFFGSSM